MQNELDDGTILYQEYTDTTGFVIREMIKTKNASMRFQAGKYVRTPMMIPVYKNTVITHHRVGDDIDRFLIHGFAKTLAVAIERACNKLLREDIKNLKR
jgi:hypothetical protein